MEKENTGSAPAPSNITGQRIFGFIEELGDGGANVIRVFGIGKNSVNMGRGSKNDIRLNARMFSRLHVTISITEEDDSLRVELKNESQQKNATKVHPYVLPFQNSVILENPSTFLLQGRSYRWVENDEKYQIPSSVPITYLYGTANKLPGQKLDEDDDGEAGKGVESPSQATPTPRNSSPAPKRRRSGLNQSLELRKAAHRRSFRSSVRQIRQSAPLPVVEEDDQEELPSSQHKTCDLIMFSPDSVPTPPSQSPNVSDVSNTSLITHPATPLADKSVQTPSRSGDGNILEESAVLNGENDSMALTPRSSLTNGETTSDEIGSESAYTRRSTAKLSTPTSLSSQETTSSLDDESIDSPSLKRLFATPNQTSPMKRMSTSKKNSQESPYRVSASPQRRSSRLTSSQQTPSRNVEEHSTRLTSPLDFVTPLSSTRSTPKPGSEKEDPPVEETPPTSFRRSSRNTSNVLQEQVAVESPSPNKFTATPDQSSPKKRTSSRTSINSKDTTIGTPALQTLFASQTPLKSASRKSIALTPGMLKVDVRYSEDNARTPKGDTPNTSSEVKTVEQAASIDDGDITINSTLFATPPTSSRKSSRTTSNILQEKIAVDSPSPNMLFATPDQSSPKKRTSSRATPSLKDTSMTSIGTPALETLFVSQSPLKSASRKSIALTPGMLKVDVRYSEDNAKTPKGSTPRRSSRVKAIEQTPNNDGTDITINSTLFATPMASTPAVQRINSAAADKGTPFEDAKIDATPAATPRRSSRARNILEEVTEQEQQDKTIDTPSFHGLFTTPTAVPGLSVDSTPNSGTFPRRSKGRKSTAATESGVFDTSSLTPRTTTASVDASNTEVEGETMDSPLLNQLFATPTQTSPMKRMSTSSSKKNKKESPYEASSQRRSSRMTSSQQTPSRNDEDYSIGLTSLFVTPLAETLPTTSGRSSRQTSNLLQEQAAVESPLPKMLYSTPDQSSPKKRTSSRATPSLKDTSMTSIGTPALETLFVSQSPLKSSSRKSIALTPGMLKVDVRYSEDNAKTPKGSTPRRSSRVKAIEQTPNNDGTTDITINSTLFATPMASTPAVQRINSAAADKGTPFEDVKIDATPAATPRRSSRASNVLEEVPAVDTTIDTPSINILFTTPAVVVGKFAEPAHDSSATPRRSSGRKSGMQAGQTAELEPDTPVSTPTSMPILEQTPKQPSSKKRTSMATSSVKDTTIGTPALQALFASPSPMKSVSRKSIAQTPVKADEKYSENETKTPAENQGSSSGFEVLEKTPSIGDTGTVTKPNKTPKRGGKGKKEEEILVSANEISAEEKPQRARRGKKDGETTEGVTASVTPAAETKAPSTRRGKQTKKPVVQTSSVTVDPPVEEEEIQTALPAKRSRRGQKEEGDAAETGNVLVAKRARKEKRDEENTGAETPLIESKLPSKRGRKGKKEDDGHGVVVSAPAIPAEVTKVPTRRAKKVQSPEDETKATPVTSAAETKAPSTRRGKQTKKPVVETSSVTVDRPVEEEKTPAALPAKRSRRGQKEEGNAAESGSKVLAAKRVRKEKQDEESTGAETPLLIESKLPSKRRGRGKKEDDGVAISVPATPVEEAKLPVKRAKKGQKQEEDTAAVEKKITPATATAETKVASTRRGNKAKEPVVQTSSATVSLPAEETETPLPAKRSRRGQKEEGDAAESGRKVVVAKRIRKEKQNEESTGAETPLIESKLPSKRRGRGKKEDDGVAISVPTAPVEDVPATASEQNGEEEEKVVVEKKTTSKRGRKGKEQEVVAAALEKVSDQGEEKGPPKRGKKQTKVLDGSEVAPQQEIEPSSSKRGGRGKKENPVLLEDATVPSKRARRGKNDGEPVPEVEEVQIPALSKRGVRSKKEQALPPATPQTPSNEVKRSTRGKQKEIGVQTSDTPPLIEEEVVPSPRPTRGKRKVEKEEPVAATTRSTRRRKE